MKPTGKSYGGFNLYAHTPKRYRCDRCSHVITMTTNHYQPTWSHGHYGVCPMCPPWAKYPEFGGQTTWTCLDKPEEEAGAEQSFAESVQQEAEQLLPAPEQESEPKIPCECGDPGCPVCHGHCRNRATCNLRRVDMEDRTGTKNMSEKYTEPKQAISRSISHNEIAWLEADSRSDAKELLSRIDGDENVTELDWADSMVNLVRPIIDVWGKRAGEDFRLYICWPIEEAA